MKGVAVRHVAGEFVDGEQFCVVCGLQICDYTQGSYHSTDPNWEPKGFPEGPLWIQGKNPTFYSSEPIEPFVNCKP